MEALAYYRTSSQTNVLGDSKVRQAHAVKAYAKANGIQIVAEFNDPAVSGSDPIDERAGFGALLDRVDSNGVRLVIVEEPSRLARNVLTYELAVVLLQSRGVEVYAANGDCLTATEDEMATAMRQIIMVFSQLEKQRLVKKMKLARDRKRQETGKCEGRKSHLEIRPAVVKEARRLRRKSPLTGKRRSLRQVATELAALGMVNENGRPYAAQSVQNMMIG